MLSTKFIQVVPLEGSVTALTCLIIMLNLHQISANSCHQGAGTIIHKCLIGIGLKALKMAKQVQPSLLIK